MLYEPAPSSSAAPRNVASLEDYLEALRRRKVFVVVVMLLILGASVAYTNRRSPYYEAHATVLVNPTPAGGNNGNLGTPNLENETTLLLSDAVSTAARTALGDPAGAASEGSVSAGSTPNSSIITVSASSVSPERAAKLANTYATTYVASRVADQAGYYDGLVNSINAELTTLAPVIADETTRLDKMDQDRTFYEALPQDVARNSTLAQIANDRGVLSAQYGTDTNRQRALQSQLLDIQRTRTIQAPAGVVISSAGVPGSPAGVPNWAIVLAGLVVGFALATVMAFLLERLDRSAQTAKDVELAIGRRVIGAVPRFSWRFRRGQWALVMANDRPARSLQPTREAYRRLRSSLLFLARAQGAQSIVITSSQALEGKSTTAANLAATLALAGNRVALVSADLRRPSLERLFDISNDTGLSTYLSGHSSSVRVESVPGFDSLIFVPAGPEPRNPGELLGSPRFAELIATLCSQVDLVIIDTPPLGAAADALSAAAIADGVVLVVDGKRTETTELLAIRNELDRSGGTLLGAVLNRDTSTKAGLLRRRGRYSYYSGDRGIGTKSGATVESDSRIAELASRLEDSTSARPSPRSAKPAAAKVTVTETSPAPDTNEVADSPADSEEAADILAVVSDASVASGTPDDEAAADDAVPTADADAASDDEDEDLRVQASTARASRSRSQSSRRHRI